MKACPAREEALALLKKYNSEPFHIQHALTVEGVMRWYANELGYGEDADFWATVGLLHDVDFEKWPEQPAANFLSLYFFFRELTSISCTDLLGRIRAAAPMSPVSSSAAKRTFSISSTGSTSQQMP